MAEVETASPVIQEFIVPDEISSPHSIVVRADGTVWFAEKVGKNLVRFDLEKREFKAYPLPPDWGNLGPSQLAVAPDGSIWFSVRRWANSHDGTWFLGQFDPDARSF